MPNPNRLAIFWRLVGPPKGSSITEGVTVGIRCGTHVIGHLGIQNTRYYESDAAAKSVSC